MTTTILAPLAMEARAIRLGASSAVVQRTGMGNTAAANAARAISAGDGPVVVAGTCGGLEPRLEAGDLVVASAVTGPDRQLLPLPEAAPLVAALRSAGLTVHHGPIVSVDEPVSGDGRVELVDASGALAVDMESAAAVRALRDGDHRRPVAVIRAVADTARHPLFHPRTVIGGATALLSLRRAVPGIEDWARAAGDRRVLLAGPRSFCAGVDRAIEIVERALEQHGAPVYVRKQIVHNAHVVADLEQRGAVFVDELDEVPDGALTIFSAHGVSPMVREDAAERGLEVIDATCPLVEKVHVEARRFARDGYDIVLIGHEGHEEVEGTSGEAPAVTHLVDDLEDIDRLDVRDPERVAVLSQTTLAVDEVSEVIDGLRARFPELAAPKADDICYATQNRQDAVRAVATDAELVLVVGSTNSSNSKRLVEVAERAGATGYLVDDATEVDPRWLHGVGTVGLTAGASAPESLVQDLVECLQGFGHVEVQRRDVRDEDVVFTLPKQLRGT